MADRQPIQHQDLLTMANQMIRDHEDFIQGMQADQVEQKGGILVFKGEFFLDEQGLPTPKPWRSSTCSNTWRRPSLASTNLLIDVDSRQRTEKKTGQSDGPFFILTVTIALRLRVAPAPATHHHGRNRLVSRWQ